MQVKEVKPINFLFYRTETKVSELSNHFPVAKEIFREAVNLDLHITGPVHWHYTGFAGDESKPFILEIALPVSKVIPDYDGKFHFKRTAPFKCVITTHEGPWNEIPMTYNKMFQFISKNKMDASTMIRELYVNADFESPDANVTEIQIGLN